MYEPKQPLSAGPITCWGGDTRTEGQRACIVGGTVTRSIYGKEKMGVPKKPPMYLHVQTAGGAHRVGYNVNKKKGPNR